MMNKPKKGLRSKLKRCSYRKDKSVCVSEPHSAVFWRRRGEYWEALLCFKRALTFYNNFAAGTDVPATSPYQKAWLDVSRPAQALPVARDRSTHTLGRHLCRDRVGICLSCH
jgi:hypothetical protein